MVSHTHTVSAAAGSCGRKRTQVMHESCVVREGASYITWYAWHAGSLQ